MIAKHTTAFRRWPERPRELEAESEKQDEKKKKVKRKEEQAHSLALLPQLYCIVLYNLTSFMVQA